MDRPEKMKRDRPRREVFFELAKRREKGRKAKLIVGVDFDNPQAANVIGYIRSGLYKNREQIERYPEFWLSLEEMDKLGVLLLLSARFWAKTRNKREKVARSEVDQFRASWKRLEAEWPLLGRYEPPEELDEEN